MIGPNQTGFRLVLDLIHHTNDFNIPGFLSLIDFEKAFDKLKWNLIQDAHTFFHSGLMLGVVFMHNSDDLFHLNYQPKLSCLQNSLHIWKSRDLTPTGRKSSLKPLASLNWYIYFLLSSKAFMKAIIKKQNLDQLFGECWFTL